MSLDSNEAITFEADPVIVGPTSITVNNVAPVFDGLTNSAVVPGVVLPPNQTVTVTGPFIDPGSLAIHLM